MDSHTIREVATTIVFLRDEDTILLAMKKRGFGMGRWNGVGGKLEPGETSEACAKRETLEEIGVRALTLTKVAEMTFHEFHEGIPSIVRSDVYICNQWQGEPTETEEMAPQWFSDEKLPLDTMWPDDALWLPRVLLGEKLRCSFTFDANDTIVESTIEAVQEFTDA